MTSADYVIFHAPTHTRRPSTGKVSRTTITTTSSSSSASKKKTKGPVRVMVSMEQPKYAAVLSDSAYLHASFDVTLTYSRAIHFPRTELPNLSMSYYPLNIVSPQAVLQPPRDFLDKDGYGTGRCSL